jgi:hypothetical protein
MILAQLINFLYAFLSFTFSHFRFKCFLSIFVNIMISERIIERKTSCGLIGALRGNFPGRTEESHAKPQSG